MALAKLPSSVLPLKFLGLKPVKRAAFLHPRPKGAGQLKYTLLN
jgi:hypothetical protein